MGVITEPEVKVPCLVADGKEDGMMCSRKPMARGGHGRSEVIFVKGSPQVSDLVVNVLLPEVVRRCVKDGSIWHRHRSR